MPDHDATPELSDAEARAVAEQIVRARHLPPGADGRAVLTATSPESQSSTDPTEDRIEQALIDMGELTPEQTVVGTRDPAPDEP